ncbi:hypothetical protein I4F81_002550 [Pyropia yezoensis]|uniref:Uncharacterized protein n=1 Tax=Pyropia yezoensis TaxID=2788 RepID=A0ACC3BPW0_PYRYE|nr:hypothetical protein I4F81_002550 [Neopyropia yezoensis]
MPPYPPTRRRNGVVRPSMVGAVPTVTGAGGGEEPDGDGLPVALKDFMPSLSTILGSSPLSPNLRSTRRKPPLPPSLGPTPPPVAAAAASSGELGGVKAKASRGSGKAASAASLRAATKPDPDEAALESDDGAMADGDAEVGGGAKLGGGSKAGSSTKAGRAKASGDDKAGGDIKWGGDIKAGGDVKAVTSEKADTADNTATDGKAITGGQAGTSGKTGAGGKACASVKAGAGAKARAEADGTPSASGRNGKRRHGRAESVDEGEVADKLKRARTAAAAAPAGGAGARDARGRVVELARATALRLLDVCHAKEARFRAVTRCTRVTADGDRLRNDAISAYRFLVSTWCKVQITAAGGSAEDEAAFFRKIIAKGHARMFAMMQLGSAQRDMAVLRRALDAAAGSGKGVSLSPEMAKAAASVVERFAAATSYNDNLAKMHIDDVGQECNVS